jgi:hypothetical protein
MYFFLYNIESLFILAIFKLNNESAIQNELHNEIIYINNKKVHIEMILLSPKYFPFRNYSSLQSW